MLPTPAHFSPPIQRPRQTRIGAKTAGLDWPTMRTSLTSESFRAHLPAERPDLFSETKLCGHRTSSGVDF